jgi:hypothetical protein
VVNLYQPPPPRRSWAFRPMGALQGLTPAGFAAVVLLGLAVALYGAAAVWVFAAVWHG